MNRCQAGLLLLVSALTSSLTWAASAPDELFKNSEILELTLNGPFSTIDKERDKEKRYEGTISYQAADLATVTLDVTYEVRGNWRLQKSNCGHAQLWLDLKRGQTPTTLFENQNRLKLVVQCGERDSNQQWLVKEQLGYDIFSQFSDLNFDTRLVQATYNDSEKIDEQRTHLAFFIEHQNRVAERFGFQKFELNRAPRHSLDSKQANLVSLFMLLIGNTDFALTAGAPDDECCHNAKLLTDSDGINFPFPYDFDSSGYVDASYASPPNEAMNIRTNKQRLYRGYCSHTDVLDEALDEAIGTQASVEGLINSSEFASKRTKTRALKFFEEYYSTLGDDRKVQRSIVGKCR
ncbi:MAG: hypothetical protein ACI945_000316 [Pseudohongiellaceae bacterium]|jgi:hypothetical protein